MELKLPSGKHYGETLSKRRLGNLTLVETRYAPQLRIPRHAHERACLCLVLRGACQENFTRKSFTCRAFSFLFRPAGEVHWDQFSDNGTRTLIIELETSWLDDLREHAVRLDEPTCLQGRTLNALGTRLYAETRQLDDATVLTVEGLLLEVAAEVARESERDSGRKPPVWLERAREILKAYYSHPPTSLELANLVDVHAVHLAREFRRHYHCTMGEYVRQIRIEHACRQISLSNTPLVEIALAAGFANQAHFSRCFKQITNMTPSQFRAAARAR